MTPTQFTKQVASGKWKGVPVVPAMQQAAKEALKGKK